MVAASREMTGELFAKFMSDVNRSVFELIRSNDNVEKMAGILAIGMEMEVVPMISRGLSMTIIV